MVFILHSETGRALYSLGFIFYVTFMNNRITDGCDSGRCARRIEEGGVSAVKTFSFL